MKIKQRVDTIIDSILIIIGCILLILPIFINIDMKYLFPGIMGIYALLNMIQFILTKESKDYEGLYTAIISLGIGFVGLSFNFANPIQLSLAIISWVILMCIAKLIKTNYYNDKRDRMFKLRIITLIIFFILGVLTSINLYQDINTQILVLGYFFFAHGILELIDPITKWLIGR